MLDVSLRGTLLMSSGDPHHARTSRAALSAFHRYQHSAVAEVFLAAPTAAQLKQVYGHGESDGPRAGSDNVRVNCITRLSDGHHRRQAER